MNEFLNRLSSRSFVEIKNTFDGVFFASQERCTWHIKAEHCTHRGFYAECKGKNLEVVIEDVLNQIIEIEQRHERKEEAFATLYPEKDEYDIAELARNIE